jgi:DtxR family transcriptional regulator, Mn-dependent transcriptional regulator
MPREVSDRDYDCMVSVHNLTSSGWPARVKDIAESMNVKPPTAVEFLERLTSMSLVEKGTTGYKVSEKGTKLLDKVTRAHRLFETLLFRAGIPREKACKISSSIDRRLDNWAMTEICTQLKHPETCPHGIPIPPGDSRDHQIVYALK